MFGEVVLAPPSEAPPAVVDVEDEADEEEEEVELAVVPAELVAKSKVVESTANSVGEPTRSKVMDEALEAGPEPAELAVDETEVAKMFVCPMSFCC